MAGEAILKETIPSDAGAFEHFMLRSSSPLKQYFGFLIYALVADKLLATSSILIVFDLFFLFF